MSLEQLRQKVIFHNSVDVWITVCNEKNVPWNDTDKYQKFISYLLDHKLNLKAFNLCAHEAGETEQDKTAFTESLREINDPNAAIYTIKLNDATLDIIKKYDFS